MGGSIPQITVLMPAYNAELYIGEAVASILAQSYTDFELLIINDGSTDKTVEIVRGFSDERIRLFSNDSNLGIVSSLNHGIELARGAYIVRMDSDDISRRERLARQITFMNSHTQLGISGTWIRLFGKQPGWVVKSPVGQENVLAYTIFDNPMFHPTVIMRSSLIKKFNLRYDHEFSRTEDYRFWQQGSRFFPMDNLSEPLVNFRVHEKSVTATTEDVMRKQTNAILRQQLLKIGIEPTEAELESHHTISRGYRLKSNSAVLYSENWLLKLRRNNQQMGYVNDYAFLNVLGMIWFRLCLNSSPLGWWILRRYCRSPLSLGYKPDWQEYLRFISSIAFHSIKKIGKIHL